ncbi:MAG: carboxymuconolactone decarboxylase family protein [Rhodothermus sp.]|nr:carboxymuconolactone decarboxylase family protein [Rhodothermus sp.]
MQLTVATWNACHYCTAAHGTAALRMGLKPEQVDAILEGRLPENERLALLVETTRQLLERRGWLSDATVQTLETRGLSRALRNCGAFGLKTIIWPTHRWTKSFNCYQAARIPAPAGIECYLK